MSYILMAKMPKPESDLHPLRQKAGASRADEREELRQFVRNSSKNTSHTVWIVKSTAGSKGMHRSRLGDVMHALLFPCVTEPLTAMYGV